MRSLTVEGYLVKRVKPAKRAKRGLLIAILLAALCAGSATAGTPRPDPHPSAKGKRVTIVQPDGVYVCSRTLCITIDLAKWAKIGARYARTQMLPGDGGGGAGLCYWWQQGSTVYKSPGYMYVFQPDGYYLLRFRYGYATCGWLAQIGNYAWVGT